MKIGWRTYFVNGHMYEKNGNSRINRLFAVYNRTLRDRRTHVHTACQDNTVQLCWNSVKNSLITKITLYQNGYITDIDLTQYVFSLSTCQF